MVPRLQDELQQTKPFANLESEAYLNLVRTVDCLTRQVCEPLRAEGLSGPQYNVLRILRGAGDEGRTCGEIAARMVSSDPDVTRLLDRLAKRGWLTRTRDESDRRVVRARLSPAGHELLAQLDEPLNDAHRAALGHLGEARLRQLIDLLEAARQPA